jgi:protocatechuate 3,4-dioxygenase, beta subunit
MTSILGYRRDGLGAHPPSLSPDYKSTVKRSPSLAPIKIAHTLSEITGPTHGAAPDADLTKQGKSEPLGERIVVAGRVLDQDGKPVPNTLVEIWQANAAGRYAHARDQHPAPLDPNFSGAGRCVTDAEGNYRFVTIKPGAYPWPNHPNAWRPAHIHFSLFGPSFATRIITQMYFPGDPLMPIDPIMNAVRGERARAAMISAFDLGLTMPDWALGYRFDVILRGRDATPTEN